MPTIFELSEDCAISDHLRPKKPFPLIKKNPCKKCLVQACCTKKCTEKVLFESYSYWRSVTNKSRETKVLVGVVILESGIISYFITKIIWYIIVRGF